MTDTPDPHPGPASGRAHLTDLPELTGVTHAFVMLSTGLRMHVTAAGDPDAPTALLPHGFPQHWWEWRKVIPPLAESYRVVAPDLRGAGCTAAPADGYTLDQVPADVLAVLDALGLRQVESSPTTSVHSLGFGSASTTPNASPPFLCLGPHP